MTATVHLHQPGSPHKIHRDVSRALRAPEPGPFYSERHDLYGDHAVVLRNYRFQGAASDLTTFASTGADPLPQEEGSLVRPAWVRLHLAMEGEASRRSLAACLVRIGVYLKTQGADWSWEDEETGLLWESDRHLEGIRELLLLKEGEELDIAALASDVPRGLLVS